jgi:hypothetical protein
MPDESDDTAEQRKAERRVALECPDCFSHRAELIHTGKTIEACCLDCDRVYSIKYRQVEEIRDDVTPDQPPQRKKRKMDSEQLPIVPATRPSPSELGPLTEYVTATIQGGPKAFRAAQKEANRLAKKFGIDFEAQWLLRTKWLEEWASGEVSHGVDTSKPIAFQSSPLGLSANRNKPRDSRMRVRAAMAYRARFLVLYAILGSKYAACRKAKVSHHTIDFHLRNDPDFATQAEAAKAHFVDLLHARAVQRAIEGDCEPVFWQGIEVGHIRKFDSRLQIELLRAHMPDKFKTPGQALINVDTGDKILVMDEATRMKLIDRRREALLAQRAEAKQ